MSGPAAQTCVLDREVRRSRDRRLLVGGTPPRVVRLSAAGADALDALLGGRPHPGAAALARRLGAGGLLHPLPRAGTGAGVSFVIPLRDGGPEIAALVGELRGHGEVIVVDDGSADGSPELARAAGARLLTTGGHGSPARARNVGLAATDTPFVAFVDADCRCPADWAGPLAGLLAEDERLAIAAPRVRSAFAPGRIARYEAACSPLDMGPDPALVGSGRRVAYVPAAALVARRTALVELGGFDERLRFGEDVDLVWRAEGAGWRVRYCPQAEVLHRPRASLAQLARQRFGYGSSAAPLDRRHPGAVAPLRIDRASGSAWAATALAGPLAGALASAAALALTTARSDGRVPRPALAALALRAQMRADAELARALAREWLPLTVAAALASRRARRLALACLAADAARAAARGPLAPGPAFLLTRALDNLSYCAGLWAGAARLRSPAALLPRGPRRKP